MMTRKYNKYPYLDREGRNRFVGEELADYLGKKVLNVGGGGKRHLAAYLPTGIDYFEMDICGEPDIKVDLVVLYLRKLIIQIKL